MNTETVYTARSALLSAGCPTEQVYAFTLGDARTPTDRIKAVDKALEWVLSSDARGPVRDGAILACVALRVALGGDASLSAEYSKRAKALLGL